jgi:hypothetical protein
VRKSSPVSVLGDGDGDGKPFPDRKSLLPSLVSMKQEPSFYLVFQKKTTRSKINKFIEKLKSLVVWIFLVL